MENLIIELLGNNIWNCIIRNNPQLWTGVDELYSGVHVHLKSKQYQIVYHYIIHDCRFYMKGYVQTEGIYYFETYTLVVQYSTMRIVLILMLSKGWTIK